MCNFEVPGILVYDSNNFEVLGILVYDSDTDTLQEPMTDDDNYPEEGGNDLE